MYCRLLFSLSSLCGYLFSFSICVTDVWLGAFSPGGSVLSCDPRVVVARLFEALNRPPYPKAGRLCAAVPLPDN